MQNKLSVYRVIAMNALMCWFGLSEKEALFKVTNESFEELESEVCATNSIKKAVDKIGEIIELNNDEKADFLNLIIDRENVYQTAAIEQKFCELRCRSKVLESPTKRLKILSHIHDGWVEGNAKKFNQEGREEKRCQHLPIAFIGFNEVKADLLFVEPIFDEISTKTNLVELKETYNKYVLIKKEKLNIKTKEDLVNKILEGSEFYAVLNEQNTAETKEIASSMAEKVIAINANMFEKAKIIEK